MNSAIPVGTSSHVTTVTIWSIAVRNSLCTKREPSGLLGESCPVCVGPDLGHLRPPGAGDDEAPREQFVAGLLHDRLGLAGEQRLVDLEVRRVEYVRVGRVPAARR